MRIEKKFYDDGYVAYDELPFRTRDLHAASALILKEFGEETADWSVVVQYNPLTYRWEIDFARPLTIEEQMARSMKYIADRYGVNDRN